MPLKKLGKILFTNFLEREVSNVIIMYCESYKSIHNLLNIEKVDVEISRNILWTRQVFLQDIVLSPSATHDASAEHVCFGENDGFWQLYFTYKGNDYKLEKNNCEMTLSSDCDQKDLKIELSTSVMNDQCIKANFQIQSIKAEFKVVLGKPLVRGVNVRISNYLDKDIDYVNVLFSEGNTSQKEIEPNFNKIELEKNLIQSQEFVKSSEALSYNCFGNYEHNLKFNFVCGGNCYGIECDNEKFGLPIKLTEKDYENVLEIVVHQDNSLKNVITVKTHSKKEDVPLLTESIIGRKSKVNRILKFESVGPKIEACMDRLVSALEKLREMRKQEEANGPRVFYPSLPLKLPIEDYEMEGYENKKIKLKITRQFPVCSYDIKPILKNVINCLGDLKIEWNKLSKLLDNLNSLLETLDLEKDAELFGISENVRMIRSMHTIDILCKILIPSGLDERGLRFYTSKSESAREITVCTERLLSVIKEELKLWKLNIFPKDKEFAKPKNDIIKKKLIAYQNEYERSFEVFALLREELSDSLINTASELHLQERVFNITAITSSAVGVVGAGFAVAGLILAPFTAGVSLAMVATGVGVGATSGVAGVVTNIVEGVLTKKCIDSIVSLTKNDQYVCNLLSELQPLIMKQKSLLQDSKQGSTIPEAEACFREHCFRYSTTGAVSSAGLAAAKTGVHVAKTAAFKIGSVALGVAFDVTTIVFKAIKLSKGGCSELGYKLESDALLLDLELDEFRTQIESKEKKVKNGRT